MSEIIYKIEIKTTDKLCAGKISSGNSSAFQYQKIAQMEGCSGGLTF